MHRRISVPGRTAPGRHPGEKRSMYTTAPGIAVLLGPMETTEFFNHIRKADLQAVKADLEAHPDWVHARDSRGSTPLIMASYYDHRELVQWLLEKGARIDEKDGAGNTALMGVCFKGYEAMASILIDAGANVNARNGMGGTCLIFAVTFDREGIARLLIEHGADKDAVDAQGHTALYHARTQGRDHLVSMLEADS